jgi:hypothetical protein
MCFNKVKGNSAFLNLGILISGKGSSGIFNFQQRLVGRFEFPAKARLMRTVFF